MTGTTAPEKRRREEEGVEAAITNGVHPKATKMDPSDSPSTAISTCPSTTNGGTSHAADMACPSFTHVEFSCFLTRALMVENEPVKYIERLPNSLLKFLSFLYMQGGGLSQTGLSVHLNGVIQNLNLQVDSMRDLMPPKTKHYTDFQYHLPPDQAVTLHWRQYSISVLLRMPKKASTASALGDRDDGDQSGVSTTLLGEMMGKPMAQVGLEFSPPVPQSEFEELCHEATEFAYRLISHNSQMVKIYLASEDTGTWELLSTHKKRPWDSLALPRTIKEEFLEDVRQFLSNRAFYDQLGLRYKRNYLLLGPGSTGKSSLIEAVAGLLGFSLCYLNFSPHMDNARLCRLMSEIKKDSFAVIEDVDSTGIGQESKDLNVSAVTYSCLLNILDGPFHTDNLILIMTANDINHMGTAFKRVARIDRVFQFDYIREPEMKQLYEQILPPVLHPQWGEFYEAISCKPQLTAGLMQEFFVDLRLKYPEGVVVVETGGKQKGGGGGAAGGGQGTTTTKPIRMTKMVSELNKLIKSVERTQTEIEKIMTGS